MHSLATSELVRQYLEEVNRRAEQYSRRHPLRGRHDERVLRKQRHDGE